MVQQLGLQRTFEMMLCSHAENSLVLIPESQEQQTAAFEETYAFHRVISNNQIMCKGLLADSRFYTHIIHGHKSLIKENLLEHLSNSQQTVLYF